MNQRRGITFALGSVFLVSAAQLGMRWSMTRLPVPEQWLHIDSLDWLALAVVIAAILPTPCRCFAGSPPCAICRWAGLTRC